MLVRSPRVGPVSIPVAAHPAVARAEAAAHVALDGVDLPAELCAPIVQSPVVRVHLVELDLGVFREEVEVVLVAAGQDVAIPISFRGLAQAMDALAKEK